VTTVQGAGRGWRTLVGVALPLLLVGLAVVPYLRTRDDLPSPLAGHFTGSGAADGSIPLGVYLALVVVFVLGSAAVLVRAGRQERLGVEAPFAAFLGALYGLINVQVLLANRGQARWEDVEVAPWSILAVLAGAVLVGLLAGLAVQRTGGAALGTWDTAPRPSGRAVDLAPGERVAWFGSTGSRVLAGVAVVLLVAGTALLFVVPARSAGVTMLVSAALVATFARVHVVVDERGVTVRGGALPWPRVRVALDEIEAARSVDLDPSKLGWASGWGYRGSLRLGGKAAWVLRRGPALELELTGGRRFAVTVDRADEAAAALAGLLDRRRR